MMSRRNNISANYFHPHYQHPQNERAESNRPNECWYKGEIQTLKQNFLCPNKTCGYSLMKGNLICVTAEHNFLRVVLEKVDGLNTSTIDSMTVVCPRCYDCSVQCCHCSKTCVKDSKYRRKMTKSLLSRAYSQHYKTTHNSMSHNQIMRNSDSSLLKSGHSNHYHQDNMMVDDYSDSDVNGEVSFPTDQQHDEQGGSMIADGKTVDLCVKEANRHNP